MKLVNIYLTNFYGSSLWDLSNIKSDKLWTTWNTLIRNTFNLHYKTHRFVLNIYEGQHLKTKLLSRFINFYKLASSSDKPTIKTLLSKQRDDIRSSFGRNCKLIQNMCNVPNIKDASVRDIPVYPVPTCEEWRLVMIKELLDSDLVVQGFEGNLHKAILDDLCIN